jgi:hypothetical protein
VSGKLPVLLTLAVLFGSILFVFAAAIRKASRLLDRVLADEPAAELFRAGDDPGELELMARTVGVWWEENPAESAAMARARRILAGDAP